MVKYQKFTPSGYEVKKIKKVSLWERLNSDVFLSVQKYWDLKIKAGNFA